MEGEKRRQKTYPGFRVEVMGAWAGKGSWNGKWGTESRGLGKWEKKVSLAHPSGEMAGKKCQKSTDRRDRKKPKAGPDSPHDLKSETGTSEVPAKELYVYFFVSATLL